MPLRQRRGNASFSFCAGKCNTSKTGIYHIVFINFTSHAEWSPTCYCKYDGHEKSGNVNHLHLLCCSTDVQPATQDYKTHMIPCTIIRMYAITIPYLWANERKQFGDLISGHFPSCRIRKNNQNCCALSDTDMCPYFSRLYEAWTQKGHI
jgi:hypothetical protein